MVKINEFEVGQVWMVTTKSKRVAKVLAVGQEEVEIPDADPTKPPSKQMRGTVHVRIVTPSRPIRGWVTSAEADENLNHRLNNLDIFGYDMWEEVWIDCQRNRVVLGPRPRVYEKEWEWVLKVHRVIGRHAKHETTPSGSKLGPMGAEYKFFGTGTVIDAVLIPPGDVHPQLFDELGVNEKTQAQLDMEAHDKQVIAEHEKKKAAEAKEARKGDAAECQQWAPSSRLKMQLDVCGLDRPGAEHGHFNMKARASLATYLKSIGVNPWDVMDMNREEFTEAVGAARSLMAI